MPSIFSSDKRKAVCISLAAGLIDMAIQDEKPLSFQHNTQSAALDKLLRSANAYTGGGFQGPTIQRCSQLLDKFEAMINEEFPKI